jgi:hypothetical protein
MSKEERRRFSREFKLKAVERLEAGESGSALARELDVQRILIYRWRDAVRHSVSCPRNPWASAPDRAPGGSGGLSAVHIITVIPSLTGEASTARRHCHLRRRAFRLRPEEG